MVDHSSTGAEILVVVDEDCSDLSLNYFFSVAFGYRTRFVRGLKEAFGAVFAVGSPALFVLCTAEINSDSFALIKEVTASSDDTFVLVLTTDGDPETPVRLFEAGTDEALRLPLSLRELAYRLRSRSSEIGLAFDFDPDQAKTLDAAADIVRRAELTDVEAQVVLVLMEQGGGIVSRDELSLAIDKKPWSYGNRKFDVHVASIRKKLDSAYGGDLTVRTVRTAGYQLTLEG